MPERPKLLTIAIPTYNRGAKALRLLRSFWAQVRSDGLEDDVEFLVSDNASVDETSRFLEEAQVEGIPLTATRQPRNLGFDGNVLYLFDHSRTAYLWIFGDDDIPLDGAVARVVRLLREKQPDLLLFSFQQPPGSSVRQFEHPLLERESLDPGEAIDLALTYTKVSIYVFRRIPLSPENRRYIDRVLGTHWLYLGLVFCTLAQAGKPRTVVWRDQLARCDDDFLELTGEPPEFLREFHRIMDHPFIASHRPQVRAEWRRTGYRWCIGFAILAWGDLKYQGAAELRLRKFVRELRWEFDILLREPKLFAQLLLLKSGGARLYRLYRAARRGPAA